MVGNEGVHICSSQQAIVTLTLADVNMTAHVSCCSSEHHQTSYALMACRFVRIHDTSSKEQRAQVYVKQTLSAVALYQGPVLAPLPSKVSDAAAETAADQDQSVEHSSQQAAPTEGLNARDEDGILPVRSGRRMEKDGKKRHHQGPRSGRLQKHRTK